MSVISREDSFHHSDSHSMSSDLEMELAGSPVRASKPTSPFEGPEAVTSWAANICEVPRSDPDPPPIQPSPTISQSPRQPMTPRERFQASVQKVIAMHRGSNALKSHSRVGAEPGVDPRRDSAFIAYGHIQQRCLIEIVDYSSVRSSASRMTNAQFVKLINDDRVGRKEPWAKVRWINVGGISWDVVSALALKYGALQSHACPA